jgi:hypothetical protein
MQQKLTSVLNDAMQIDGIWNKRSVRLLQKAENWKGVGGAEKLIGEEQRNKILEISEYRRI